MLNLITMEKGKPLSPSEIKYDIPDFVIDAVNRLLEKNFRGKACTIKAKDIISEGQRTGRGGSNKDWYKEKWMDFENIFREHGWVVEYESSSYGESSFDSFYRFTPKK
jgi:hypothetical protein